MNKNYKLDKFTQCTRCNMKFRIRLPIKSKGYRSAEWSRCTEPKCGRRFWSAATHPTAKNGYGAPKSSVVCGVDPKDYEEF